MVAVFEVSGAGLSRLRSSRICGEALLAGLPRGIVRTRVVIVSLCERLDSHQLFLHDRWCSHSERVLRDGPQAHA